MFSKKTNKRLDENEVIQYLINFKPYDGYPDLRHFYNMIHYPVRQEEFSKYRGMLVAHEIIRTELGFDNSSKPGDFDVIIIPFSKDKIYFERTAVFEIKVVRPTRKKPSRNANSLGVTQVQGLIQDGFPLVSLMHVCMPEPFLEEETMTIQHVKEPINIDGHFDNKRKFYDRIDVKVDLFSMASADTQMQRLIATDLPKFVGLGAYGLNFYEDGSSSISSCSQDFWSFQYGYFNPYTKQETIEKVMIHYLNFKDKYQIKPVR